MTNALWYMGRGTGVSALVLFTVVVLLGIVVRAGQPLPGLPRFAVAAVHRTTSLTALLLLLTHITTLLFDPYAQLRLVDVVVPFAGAYKPAWLGLGTVAFDLILALIASSLLRTHVGLRTWRLLHWSSYACWPVAMAHAIGNGTDGTSLWLLTIAAGCAASVVAALLWRVVVTSTPDRAVLVPAPVNLTGMR
jgi:sulfoxide reductase heme-binding subunit YedZ